MSESTPQAPESKHSSHGHWSEVDQDSRRFQALLRKYHGKYQDATDAYLRGEEPEEKYWGPSTNPM